MQPVGIQKPLRTRPVDRDFQERTYQHACCATVPASDTGFSQEVKKTPTPAASDSGLGAEISYPPDIFVSHIVRDVLGMGSLSQRSYEAIHHLQLDCFTETDDGT